MRMKICVNCGVEIEDGLRICPLCGKDPGIKSEHEKPSFSYPSDVIQLSRTENRRYLWELSGIISFSFIAVCTILDLIISKRLGWSLFVDISVLASWVILTLLLYAYRQTWVIASGLMVTILITLFLADFIAPGRKWFFPVGLPLTIAAGFVAGIVIILYRAAKFKGLNIIAATLVVLSGFCIITEIIMDKYLNGFVELRWSLIEAVSIIPVVLILFFYHYRLKKGSRLDSFFHI
jgi:hypothetical protein